MAVAVAVAATPAPADAEPGPSRLIWNWVFQQYPILRPGASKAAVRLRVLRLVAPKPERRPGPSRGLAVKRCGAVARRLACGREVADRSPQRGIDMCHIFPHR